MKVYFPLFSVKSSVARATGKNVTLYLPASRCLSQFCQPIILVALVTSWHQSRVWCWRPCSVGALGRFFLFLSHSLNLSEASVGKLPTQTGGCQLTCPAKGGREADLPTTFELLFISQPQTLRKKTLKKSWASSCFFVSLTVFEADLPWRRLDNVSSIRILFNIFSFSNFAEYNC